MAHKSVRFTVLGVAMAALQANAGDEITRRPPRGTSDLVETSAGASDRLAQQPQQIFVNDFDFRGPTVHVSSATDQEIIGFGAAFTEAAALVFRGLPQASQQRLLDLYWGNGGIGYSLGRVPINSCDFSPGSYSFASVPGDYALEHFDNNVTHDAEALIPFIQAAQATVRKQGRDLKLLATPWSPPTWMKTNGQMDGSGTPGLKQMYQGTWAAYFAKWITAYKSYGIPIWAVTPQNEPENNAPWEACLYTAEQEMVFLSEHLGPTLERAHPEVKIFVFDHNKDHVQEWAQALYTHPSAGRFADGVAFHWYSGDSFENVRSVHSSFPQALLLPSEATYERWRWHAGTTLQTGDWSFGEGYAHDVLGDLNAGAAGWIDWNLLLDQSGGPNHVNNVCDAAIIAEGGEIYVHPQYYFLGHFSKYVLPQSRRLVVEVANSVSYAGVPRPYGTCSGEDGLQAAAFLRPDGLIAAVVLNCGDTLLSFKLAAGRRALRAAIPPHAIQTYLFEREEGSNQAGHGLLL